MNPRNNNFAFENIVYHPRLKMIVMEEIGLWNKIIQLTEKVINENILISNENGNNYAGITELTDEQPYRRIRSTTSKTSNT